MDVLSPRPEQRTYLSNGRPNPGVSYRIGAAANWEDDVKQGDVFLLSDLPSRAERVKTDRDRALAGGGSEQA